MTAQPPPGGSPYEPPPQPGQQYGNPQGGGYGAPYGTPGQYGPPQGPPGAYGAPQGAPLPPGVPAPLAEWWERWVARIIDNVVFWVVYLILSTILTSIFLPSAADIMANPSLSVAGAGILPGLLAALIVFGGYAAYDYVLHSKDGQTLGKKVMKIRLVALGGGPLDSSNLMKRSAIYPGVMALYGIPVLGWWLIPIFILVVGVLILTDKPLQQGLHDKVAGTVVVKVPR